MGRPRVVAITMTRYAVGEFPQCCGELYGCEECTWPFHEEPWGAYLELATRHVDQLPAFRPAPGMHVNELSERAASRVREIHRLAKQYLAEDRANGIEHKAKAGEVVNER